MQTECSHDSKWRWRNETFYPSYMYYIMGEHTPKQCPLSMLDGQRERGIPSQSREKCGSVNKWLACWSPRDSMPLYQIVLMYDTIYLCLKCSMAKKKKRIETEINLFGFPLWYWPTNHKGLILETLGRLCAAFLNRVIYTPCCCLYRVCSLLTFITKYS